MKRELLFRAWDVINELMVSIIGFVYESDTQVRIWYKTLNGVQNESFSRDRLIIMQYVNKDDREGVKLFEGDVLSFDQPGNEKATYIISYDPKNYFLLGADDINPERRMYLHAFRFRHTKKLGNIYADPQLLEL